MSSHGPGSLRSEGDPGASFVTTTYETTNSHKSIYSYRFCTSRWWATISKPKRIDCHNFQVFQDVATGHQKLRFCPSSLSSSFNLQLLYGQAKLNTIPRYWTYWESRENLKQREVFQPEDLWILNNYHPNDSCSSTRWLIFSNQMIFSAGGFMIPEYFPNRGFAIPDFFKQKICYSWIFLEKICPDLINSRH